MKSFEKRVLTNQQIFDKVLAHLLKQGKRAVLASGGSSNHEVCAYRAPDGRKCAAGCLIADEFYNANFEGRSADYRQVWEALIASGVPATSIGLVQALQRAHDNTLQRGVEPWLQQMQDIAGWYGLEMKPVEELLRGKKE